MRLVLQKSLQEVFNKYCIVKYIALIFSEQQRLHVSNQAKYYNRKWLEKRRFENNSSRFSQSKNL